MKTSKQKPAGAVTPAASPAVPATPTDAAAEAARLRVALRNCVEWMESDYVRKLLAYAALHAPVTPSEQEAERGQRVWQEARRLSGYTAIDDEADG